MDATRFDVRRLVAVDMQGGTAGPGRRRRVILVEFVAAAVVSGALGCYLTVDSTGAGRLWGLVVLGLGLNYLLLALHAISSSRHGVLDSYLRDVDVRGELRYYATAQLLLIVPAALAGSALVEVGRTRRRRRRGAA